MNKIIFKGKEYPEFQATGFASRFAFPFAKEFCKGKGYDIGYNRPEWKLEGAIGIDQDDNYDAFSLPDFEMDYIFSSHCLEHLDNWVKALDYWKLHLKEAGTLFLYLPHPDQDYWLPWNNRKHIHILHPEDLEKYLKENFKDVYVTGKDLNHSYYAIGVNKK